MRSCMWIAFPSTPIDVTDIESRNGRPVVSVPDVERIRWVAADCGACVMVIDMRSVLARPVVWATCTSAAGESPFGGAGAAALVAWPHAVSARVTAASDARVRAGAITPP